MRQRGFGTVDLVIYAVVAAAALGGAWALYAGIDGRGYERGKTETEAAYAKRDNEQLRKAATRISELEEQNLALEAAAAQAFSKIDKDLQRKQADAKTQRDRDVANPGSLRVPTSCHGAPVSGGSSASETAASASERDGQATAELPRQVRADLYAMVDDANAVVDQLDAAQALILKQQETCNAR